MNALREYKKAYEEQQSIIKSISSTQRKIIDNGNLIKKQKDEIKFLESNQITEINKARDEALRRTIDLVIEEPERLISELEKSVKDLEEEFNKQQEDLIPEKIKEDLQEEYTGIENLSERLDETKEIFISAFGERLYDILEKKSKVSTLKDISTAQLSEMFDHCKDVTDGMKPIKKDSVSFSKSFGYLFFDHNVIALDSKKQSIIYLLYIVIILLLMNWFSFFVIMPMYLAMTGLVIYNFYRMRNIYVYVSSLLFLSKNLHLAYERLDSDVSNLLEMNKVKLQETFNEELSALNKSLEEAKETRDLKIEEARNNFSFDEESFKKEFKIKKNALKGSIEKLEEAIDLYKFELEGLNQQKSEIDSLLNDLQNKVISEHINLEDSSNNKFPPTEFLLDFKNNELIFFSFNKESMCIVYKDEDYEEIVKFIILLAVQSFSHMNAALNYITIADNKTMGKDFLAFRSATLDVFTVLSNVNELTEELKKLNEEVTQLMDSTFNEHENIDKFNEFMISIDSLTKEYQWLFLLNYEDSILSNADFLRLLQVGGQSGIYPIVLIPSSKLSGEEVSKGYLNVFNNVTDIYRLVDGGLIEDNRSSYLKLNYR